MTENGSWKSILVKDEPKKVKSEKKSKKSIVLMDMVKKKTVKQQKKIDTTPIRRSDRDELKGKAKKLEADGSKKQKKPTGLKKAILYDRQVKWYEAHPPDDRVSDNICAVLRQVSSEICLKVIQTHKMRLVAVLRCCSIENTLNVYLLFQSLADATAGISQLSKMRHQDKIINVEPLHLSHWNTLVHLKALIPGSLEIRSNILQIESLKQVKYRQYGAISHVGSKHLYLKLPSFVAAAVQFDKLSKMHPDDDIKDWIDASEIVHSTIDHGNVIVSDMIDEEELEDPDEAQELEIEVKTYFETCPGLLDCKVQPTGQVILTFRSMQQSRAAVEQYHGRKYGGNTLRVYLDDSQYRTLIITDVVADSEAEVLEYLSQYGSIENLKMDESRVSVCYATVEAAGKALDDVRGSVYNDQVLTVDAAFSPNQQLLGEYSCYNPRRVAKVEKFPKLSSGNTIREYVDQTYDDELAALVEQFITRLMTLQERARLRDPVKAKKTRRFVFGLREVERDIRRERIKCVVVAYNIDECAADGGLDDKVRRIIDLAREQELFVIFALSRRKLGKCCGKTIRVSCVGIYNVDGANELYRQMNLKVAELKPLLDDRSEASI